MEAFTETLLGRLRTLPEARTGRWVHVDTAISRTISERERLRAAKVARLVVQTKRSAWLAARGFDAYYPISQNRIGLWRDVALLAPFRACRRGVVVHLHGGMLDRVLESESRVLVGALRWLLARPSARGIVLTPSLRHCLKPLLPPERIAVVPNTAAVPDSTRDKPATGSLRVLFIGTLVESKGYRELIEAVASLAAQGVPIELDVAGEPYAADDRRWLRRADSSPGVRLLGNVTGASKWEAFRRSHVVALPTTYPAEGQPLSIIEGMAAGCAIVATLREGIRDTVGEDEGVLVAVRSGAPLRADLERVLGSLASRRGEVELMGRAARLRYERELAPDRFIERWLTAVGG